MRVRNILKQARTSPISLKVLGVLFFMAAIAFFSPYFGGPALISAHKTDNSLPKTSYAATEDGETLQKTITPSGEVASSTPTEAAPTMAPYVDKSSKTAASSDTLKCEALTSKLMNSYRNQVKKEKNSLDDILSSVMSLPYTSMHVGDYNAKIAAIYTKQVEAAAAEHCTLPISGPDLLDPMNYSPQ